MSWSGEVGPTGPSGKVKTKEAFTLGNINTMHLETKEQIWFDHSTDDIVEIIKKMFKDLGISATIEKENEEHDGYDVIVMKHTVTGGCFEATGPKEKS